MRSLWVPCVVFALTTAATATTPQYSPRQDIPTGFKNLSGIAISDFNGDGKPDIAVTDSSTQQVVVYLNKGDGSFSAPITTNVQMTALGAGALVAGDFNEDGKQDLILGTIAGLQADIYLSGNGDGTFTEQTALAGSYGFVSGVAVDINHDSHLDFIAGGNGSLYVYVGDGHGNFQQQTLSNPGPSGLFISTVAADFNGDGKMDFATASPLMTSGVRIFLGDGDGTFSAPSYPKFSINNIAITPQYLAAADLNGDGKQDLLVGFADSAAIYYGNGDGTFNLSNLNFPATLPQTAFFAVPLVAAADMNGDGKIDVVIADDSSQTVDVDINNGSGTFPEQASPDFSSGIDVGTSHLSTADLNGDGLPDIILTNYKTQNISIFLSIKPKTTPTVTLTASSNPQFVGNSVSFTAKVAGTSGTVATGTVSLTDGTNSLGQQTLDSNGQAVFSVSNLTAGQHSLTASYSGDGNYLAASSTTLTESITDFQISFASSSQAVSAGGTANYSLTVTPVAGLTGSVTVTCSQLPTLTTCDPLTVPLNGQPATATLAVHTTAPVQSQYRSIKAAGISLISVALALFLTFRQRTYVRLLTGIFAFILVGFSIGCSGGSKPATTTTPGTPSGSTAFTITGSITAGGQTLNHTTTETLVVQ